MCGKPRPVALTAHLAYGTRTKAPMPERLTQVAPRAVVRTLCLEAYPQAPKGEGGWANLKKPVRQHRLNENPPARSYPARASGGRENTSREEQCQLT